MKESDIRVIKKYPNRRLYDTKESKYVTLADLRELVMNQEEFIVIDKKSEEDITRSVLLQIILEQEEKEGQPLFSAELLHKLIGIYGDPNQQLAGNFLNRTIEMFCEQQKLLNTQMEEAMAVNPMSALLTKMTKTNIEIWKEMQDNILKSMENPPADQKSGK
ncbi:MAG: polyhydroxyalkanoate synthesis repressor PhaR [Methylococcaceae bacterium TMED69]|nr:MAG: polyhydroxyalkanoate synthesis repressor PhaR [Methylococcaceae bacterium TMED69]|tara:strand:+ start:2014 stop:2499 length:486 start_codon:yes stop_codon:yes gene_type:complete